MNLDCCLNLKRSQRIAKAILAVQTLSLATLAPCLNSLAALFVEDDTDVGTHLLSKLLILLDLFLGVPEPLVDLLLGQIQLIDQVKNVLTRWLATLHLLEHVPEGLLLVLGLTLPPVLRLLALASAGLLAP